MLAGLVTQARLRSAAADQGQQREMETDVFSWPMHRLAANDFVRYAWFAAAKFESAWCSARCASLQSYEHAAANATQVV